MRQLPLLAVLLAACGAVSCGASAPPPPTVPAVSRGPVIDFAFETLAGTLVDSAATRGRATAVLFVASYDLASQVQAQRLQEVLRVQTPRANGLVVVLETPEYAQLAATFRDSLGLSLPTAMADEATRDGTGPFGPISRIPTLVVLDRDGHETWRRAGVVPHRDLEKALATASGQGN